eukprot:TRINITY_DN2296_c0_g1_i1.p1 TRINITY_DN2296_c0_g1~~TRINITY_DN2296_c0_g1_i1.p1  ORF type:complete len:318 (+),score=55.34 TRINITY_DN2296_c0_g1_i1:94-1047(+)
MTHSSGISVTNELNDAFSNARVSESVRWIKVQIIDEALRPVKTHPIQGNQEVDWNTTYSELLPKIPTYILYRLDSKNLQGYEWVLIAYVPDGSSVRDRMLYASSRDNLKKQLGYTYFVEDLYGSSKDDVTYEAFVEFKNRRITDHTVMTAAELQYRREVTAEIAVGTTKEYVHSVKFPISTEAAAKLKGLSNGTVTLVQLVVDPVKETIELGKALSGVVGVESGLRESIPENEPRFTLFRWEHSHNNSNCNSIVFIYSCTNHSPIKLKMLYSTVKAVANSTAEEQGVVIDKKVLFFSFFFLFSFLLPSINSSFFPDM